jgi:Mg-chelatase subunit ChlD
MDNPNFICPISQQVMQDPVCDKEGNTYERKYIEEWIRLHGTSPITRSPLQLEDLVPNRALRTLIEEATGITAPASIEIVEESQGEIDLSLFRLENTFQISILPPDTEKRPAVDLCCVIDISGSMGDRAEFKNEHGTTESMGLNVLDLVKHAVKTVIKSLSAQDRLAIVSFSNDAEVVLDLTPMTDFGQAAAMTALEKLAPYAATNLWGGLQTGMDTLKGSKLGSVLLFTDGVPNVEPPRGHLPMLKTYKDKNGGSYPGTINTFGFGYSLDSKLLNEIALEGGGQYAFIPDAAFVGTVFIHSIANLLSTCSRDTVIRIEGDVKVIGHPAQSPGWGSIISVGNLFYGQSRDLIVESTTPFEVFLDTVRGGRPIQLHASSESAPENACVRENKLRLEAVDVIRDAMTKMPLMGVSDSATCKEQQDRIETLKNTLRDSHLCKELLQDLEVQVTEAFLTQYFTRWGRHYLPSLLYAHLNQVCNNFKDPGVQVYGGKLFRTLRDIADDLFCKLPAPKPSINPRDGGSVPAYNVSMSAFHNRNNVCFHPSATVELESQEIKPIGEIVKGDVVKTRDGYATIECIVKSKGGLVSFCKVNSLLVTPWHPMWTGDEWIFPQDSYPVVDLECDYIYNLVLDTKHTVMVNDVCCVTLGHGFVDPVCAHDYFGTQRVVEDLKSFHGYSSGLVFVEGTKRGPNGCVTGMVEGTFFVSEQ